MTHWETLIGLEVHVQLATRTKLFSPEAIIPNAPPNSACHPISLGLPGTLPTLNGHAVHLALRAAIALGCHIHPVSTFARKSYFYPDLPKGYQITQDHHPIAGPGQLRFTSQGRDHTCPITRIHLEEDTAKRLQLDPHTCGIDHNRAGIPLIEIVTAPSLSSPQHAADFLRALHRCLVDAGVTLGHLDQGHLRCDANLSLRRPGQAPGVRCEIKNLNSFRFVAQALTAEADRQRHRLARGLPLTPTTLSWNHARQALRAMRAKEDSAAYRFLPEPDLPPLTITAEHIASARQALPPSTTQREETLRQNFALNPHDAQRLANYPQVYAAFCAAHDIYPHPQTLAKLLLGGLLRRDNGTKDQPPPLQARQIADAARLLDTQALSSTSLRALLQQCLHDPNQPLPSELLAQQGPSAPATPADLDALVCRVAAAHPTESARLRAGEEKLRAYFMGRCMAAAGAHADPQAIAAALHRWLRSAPPP